MGCCMKLLAGATAISLVVSCAPQPPVPSGPPPIRSIAFVTSKDLPELTRSEAEEIEKHISTGATAGAVGGAAVGAAACGPVFYGACVAIASWYGLVAGSVSGAALGLYSYTGLSETDAAYVDQVLVDIGSRRDFHNDLGKQVASKVSADAIVDLPDADYQVLVRVNQIRFVQGEKEQITTKLAGTIVLARSRESGEETHREIFVAETSPQNINDLIAGDGRLLESEIDECLAKIADLMSDRLEAMLVAGSEKSWMGP